MQRRMGQRWLAFLGLMLAVGMSAASPAAIADAAPLPLKIGAALREEGFTGAVWATVDSDGAIATGAAGLSNSANGTALAPDNKVHVGSVAKTVLATGLLQLASTGRVDLDAPLSRYLPTLPVDNRWQTSHPLRVRHLLDHTAGFEDIRLWQLFSTQATPDTPLLAALQRESSVLRLRTAPGTRFSYSNIGYTVAAMVIEAVTRERYETWLDRELLGPLRMHDSTFGFTSQIGPQADPRLAWGHNDPGAPASALPIYVRPAGQFTTTAHDLARFASFLMSDGRVDGRLLVRPELLRAMGRPSSTDAARAGLDVGYGLGLARRDRHGHVSRCHGGSVVGFRAQLCLFADGKAFALVLNTDGDGRNGGRVDALMTNALAIASTPRPAPASPAPDISHWQGRYVPAPNRMHPFRYVDHLFDSARLEWDGQALHWSPLQAEPRRLTPVGGHLFTGSDRVRPSHVLLTGDGGERLISDGLRTYRRVPALQYWAMAGSLAGGVLGLLWFLLVVPTRALLRRESALTPSVLAIGLLLVPAPLFLLQSYPQLGDRTPASIALYAATAALPWLMAWQGWRSLRQHEGLARGRANLVAALLVVQWCAVMAAWGMLPFALWR